MLSQKHRKRTHRYLNPKSGEGLVVDQFIMILIIANVAAVMLETVDPLSTEYRVFFHYFELFSVVIFSVEYGARIWSSIEGTEKGNPNPVWYRLRYAGKPLLVVDLLAILPFYLSLVGLGVDLRFLRAFRLIRLLRMFKLFRYSTAMQTLKRVFILKKGDLVLSFSITIILLIVSSSVLYFVETEAQPEVFSSIPATLWWGIITLTTVGYGDVAPITPLGQFFGGLVAILGIGLFGLPASILASGFIKESEGFTYKCPHCGKEVLFDDE